MIFLTERSAIVPKMFELLCRITLIHLLPLHCWALRTINGFLPFSLNLRARAHWPLCSATGGRVFVADQSTLGRHVCYVCKRSVCGGDEPQPVAHLSHKLQCARQSLKIMVSYGNKYPRHNARPHVVEQSGQCARALRAIGALAEQVHLKLSRGIPVAGYEESSEGKSIDPRPRKQKWGSESCPINKIH